MCVCVCVCVWCVCVCVCVCDTSNIFINERLTTKSFPDILIALWKRASSVGQSEMKTATLSLPDFAFWARNLTRTCWQFYVILGNDVSFNISLSLFFEQVPRNSMWIMCVIAWWFIADDLGRFFSVCNWGVFSNCEGELKIISSGNN